MEFKEIIKLLQTHQTDLHQHGVKELSIFGSMARGTADIDSDIDLLVAFERPVGLFEFIRLKMLLEEWLNCSVDLVTEDALRPEFRDQILKEAIHSC
nr:hypothetical protein [uncultured bacterium]